MPVNIKEPDFAADSPSTLLTRQSIVDDINSLMTAVDAKADIAHLVDVEHLAAYLSLNELIANYEIMHPKSVYLYKQNLTDGSPFVFGPVWDFDWAYGYEGRRSYYMGAENDDFYASPAFTYSGNGNAKEADRFWKHLRYGSEAIDRACYVVWYRFLQGGGIDELIDYVRHYYQFAAPSFQAVKTLSPTPVFPSILFRAFASSPVPPSILGAMDCHGAFTSLTANVCWSSDYTG